MTMTNEEIEKTCKQLIQLDWRTAFLFKGTKVEYHELPSGTPECPHTKGAMYIIYYINGLPRAICPFEIDTRYKDLIDALKETIEDYKKNYCRRHTPMIFGNKYEKESIRFIKKPSKKVQLAAVRREWQKYDRQHTHYC